MDDRPDRQGTALVPLACALALVPIGAAQARLAQIDPIGDTTNTAARLEGTPYQLFVGEATRDRLGGAADGLEFVSELEVRGCERAIRVWGLRADAAPAPSAEIAG